MKMLIEIDLDGYDTQEEMFEACEEFVLDQLNMTASGATILWQESPEPHKSQAEKMKEETDRLKQQLAGMDKLREALINDKDYLDQEAEFMPPEIMSPGFKSQGDWLPGGDVQMRGPH